MRQTQLHGYDVGAEPIGDGGFMLTMIARDRTEILSIALNPKVVAGLSRTFAGVTIEPASALPKVARGRLDDV